MRARRGGFAAPGSTRNARSALMIALTIVDVVGRK
jgi:hypothetical protein